MVRDYHCTVPEDCTAKPIGAYLPRSNHEASLLDIAPLFDWVSDFELLTAASAQNP
jgi:hypothetical protein